MRRTAGLQLRLALGLGLALTLVWLGAAILTAVSLRHEMEGVFDSSLEETAQRLLPLAVLEITNRDEEEAGDQHLAPFRDHPELFTYIVRDAGGGVLMRSHAAEPDLFPAWDGPGFSRDDTYRFYSEDSVQGSIRLTVAEPLAHREQIVGEILMRQILPLALMIPLTLAIVGLSVGLGLSGLRRFRARLATRDARDLSPVPTEGLPAELRPFAETLNHLLARLSGAFEAERSFAANAAHELRTPLAGAIAQIQRLRQETTEPAVIARATAIEETLKRLTRLAERLLQLARAEGGKLRADHPADLRPIARLLVDDLGRNQPGRLQLWLPDAPVLSSLDPDAFGIVLRNLIENALRHGTPAAPIAVSLTEAAVLTVSNAGPVVPPDVLARLTDRFARASSGDGSGLGLAIVAAIAGRIGASLDLASPRPGQPDGFSAQIDLSALS
ncbi:MAG: sensor histidine kinase N-terminal domain-containing protein [Rhodobacter sp.]|nr:sensor histidine kinase N-terminal domain-containing protein [Paracoccaceae bacterium]MCC0075459.1 sensor histidine kinase N-terminal domain-containing protein [Rhodobacter sp.]